MNISTPFGKGEDRAHAEQAESGQDGVGIGARDGGGEGDGRREDGGGQPPGEEGGEEGGEPAVKQPGAVKPPEPHAAAVKKAGAHLEDDAEGGKGDEKGAEQKARAPAQRRGRDAAACDLQQSGERGGEGGL